LLKGLSAQAGIDPFQMFSVAGRELSNSSSSRHLANTWGMDPPHDTCDRDCMFSNHRDLLLA
jgi:hypothetical protein